jgi:uncharacterized protein (TIGR02996 family)
LIDPARASISIDLADVRFSQSAPPARTAQEAADHRVAEAQPCADADPLPGARRRGHAPPPGDQSSAPPAGRSFTVDPPAGDSPFREDEGDPFAFLDEPATTDRRAPDPTGSFEITARRFVLPPPPETLDEDDDLDASETSSIAVNRFEATAIPPAAPGQPPSRFPLSSVATFGVRLETGNPTGTPRGSVVPEPQHNEYEPTSLRLPSQTGDDEVRAMSHISPAEVGLLAAMAEGHEQSRLIYMNWLDRRGERQRAEFLRVDHALASLSPHDLRAGELRHRLGALAVHISIDWRSRVSRARIENCPHAAAGCPGYWRQLPADADDVRTCGPCATPVYYCDTIDVARTRVQAGQRVAVDMIVERTVEDLSHKICPTCQAKIPVGTRFCGLCGRSTGGI